MKINTIDGRIISENIGSAYDYIEYVLGMNEYECEVFIEENKGVDELLSRIIALIYSHRLLRNTNHICGSLVDATYEMISELIKELNGEFNIEFELDLFNYY